MAIYAEFQWQCPFCDHIQIDYLDNELGPSDQVICENCGESSDIMWDEVINY